MGKIFNKKKVEGPVATTAPEESESQGEMDYVDQLDNPKEVKETPTKVVPKVEDKQVQYREVPVCMSQAQINNLIIENNIMLKQIISSMDD